MILRASVGVLAAFAIAGCGGGSSTGTTSSGGAGTSAGAAGTTGAGGKAGQGGAGGVGGGAGGTSCMECTTDADCGGQRCAQFGAGSYCAPACDAKTPCATGSTCTGVTDSAGKQAEVCVPITACGASTGAGGMGAGGSGAGGSGAGGAGMSDKCGPFDGPSVASCCTCSGTTCAANNCYNGWWCNRDACKCAPQPDPALCTTGTGGTGGSAGSAGAGGGVGPITGTVGATGGKLSNLAFAIVGDTRPPTPDDTANYPTAIISKIWQDVQAEGAPFAIMTGDYQFSLPSSGAAAGKQLDLYLQAKSVFSHVAFPAMGNHECTGATASNCGPSGKDGMTSTYTTYLAKLLTPLGLKAPYYSIRVDDAGGSWTSKFVFVAANAWDSSQGAWLTAELAKPTTYTFVVRHESSQANTAPGVDPSDAIIQKAPYTVLLVGHTHTFQYQPSSRQIITGNGGAPLGGAVPYGYVIATRRADGAIVFQAKDYSTMKSFQTFAIQADGTPTN